MDSNKETQSQTKRTYVRLSCALGSTPAWPPKTALIFFLSLSLSSCVIGNLSRAFTNISFFLLLWCRLFPVRGTYFFCCCWVCFHGEHIVFPASICSKYHLQTRHTTPYHFWLSGESVLFCRLWHECESANVQAKAKFREPCSDWEKTAADRVSGAAASFVDIHSQWRRNQRH